MLFCPNLIVHSVKFSTFYSFNLSIILLELDTVCPFNLSMIVLKLDTFLSFRMPVHNSTINCLINLFTSHISCDSVQSVPITTDVVSWNLDQGEVYNIM